MPTEVIAFSCLGVGNAALYVCVYYNSISALDHLFLASLIGCDFVIQAVRHLLILRCLIYLFIRNSHLSSIRVHTQQAQSTAVPFHGQWEIKEKLPGIITIDEAVPCQNFQLTRSVVISSKVD